MSGTANFMRRMDDATVRIADVSIGDLRRVIDELDAVPGGPAESAEAMHWALERLAADNQELSPGLHTLRDVVAT